MMNLKKIREEIVIQSVFGRKQSSPESHTLYNVTIGDLNNSFQLELSALERNKICSFVPRLGNVRIINLLKETNIIISDTQTKIEEISLLLGADIYGQLLTGRIEKVDDMVAVETHFGWTVMGSYHQKNTIETLCCFNDSTLSYLWSLDVLGIRDPVYIKKKEILEKNNQMN